MNRDLKRKATVIGSRLHDIWGEVEKLYDAETATHGSEVHSKQLKTLDELNQAMRCIVAARDTLEDL